MGSIKIVEEYDYDKGEKIFRLTSNKPITINGADEAIEIYAGEHDLANYETASVAFFGGAAGLDMPAEVDHSNVPKYSLILHSLYDPAKHCPFCGALTANVIDQIWDEAYKQGYEACLNGEPAPKGVTHE